MVDWLAVGLGLYGVGAFIQIAEEWKARGLTDTSYKALFFLIAGPSMIAFESWHIGRIVTCWFAAETTGTITINTGSIIRYQKTL